MVIHGFTNTLFRMRLLVLKLATARYCWVKDV
jgi:hypothetical protein